MEFKSLLLEKCRKIINSWDDDGIYAISFLLYPSCDDFGEFENFPEFSVGYNTEAFCENAPKFSEERWNYAFWSQNNQLVISADNEEMSKKLIKWYCENGIENIGVTSEDEYDEDFNYIGKGPGGYYELLILVAEIAKNLQNDGTINGKFGKIPVIVHDLEYTWYCKDATTLANPNGEAKDFVFWYEKCF